MIAEKTDNGYKVLSGTVTRDINENTTINSPIDVDYGVYTFTTGSLNLTLSANCTSNRSGTTVKVVNAGTTSSYVKDNSGTTIAEVRSHDYVDLVWVKHDDGNGHWDVHDRKAVTVPIGKPTIVENGSIWLQ